MDKIKTVKIKNLDGSISENSYTICTDAQYVDMKNGYNVQNSIGDINVDADGNVSNQLKNKINISDIIDNLDSNNNNKVLSARQGKILNDSIEKKPFYYNNIQEMKNDNILYKNSMAITLGYYEPNDGGAGEYIIRDRIGLSRTQLFNKNNANTVAAFVNIETGQYRAANNNQKSLLIKLEHNKTYTISGFDRKSNMGLFENIPVENSTYATRFQEIQVDSSWTFTTSSTETYLVALYTGGSTNITTYDNVMLNYGSIALPYEDYPEDEDGGSVLFLNNDLVAELIVKDYVSVKQFGAKGNNQADDTEAIQQAINLYKKIYIPDGIYKISNIILPSDREIKGNGDNSTLQSINNNINENLIETTESANKCIIRDLRIFGDNQIDNAIYLKRAQGTQEGRFDCKHILDNLEIRKFNKIGIKMDWSVRETRFLNLDIWGCRTKGMYLSGTDNMISNCSAHGCGEDGFYITGSNNKLVNCKAFINGLYGTNETIPAGITIIGVINAISNCEVQENIFDGIKIYGYTNVITGCIIDSNGSTAYDIQYDKAAGIHLLNKSGSDKGANFNGIFNNIITAGHVTGNQKYGILIEDAIGGNYTNHPSYNIIDSLCEEDIRKISPDQTFQDMINFYDENIPNISNKIIINGNDYYKDIETETLTGLTQTYYHSDASTFKIDSLTLNNDGSNLLLQSNTYVNATGSKASSAVYTLFNSNPSGQTYGTPKGLIIKYKARTNNKKITARCTIEGSYWNNDYSEQTHFHNTNQEKFTYTTLSNEFRDCVNILDMRKFNNATLNKLYLYFTMKMDNTIGQDVGTLEVEFKDIEYYLFY